MTEQHTQSTTATSTKKDHPDFKLKIGRTYTPLKMGDKIERCSFILSNSCQCWKAGEETCSDVRADGEVLTYQFCERHVRIQRAIDAGLLKPEHVTEITPDQPEFPVQVEPAQEVAPPPKVEEKKEGQEQQKESKIADFKQQQTSQKPEYKDSTQSGKEEKKG